MAHPRRLPGLRGGLPTRWAASRQDKGSLQNRLACREGPSEREEVRKNDLRFTLSGLLAPGEHSSEIKKQTKTKQQSGWSTLEMQPQNLGPRLAGSCRGMILTSRVSATTPSPSIFLLTHSLNSIMQT